MTVVSFLFTDENISSDHTEEHPQNDRLYALRRSINQEERRRDITPAHAIIVQSVMHQSVSNKWLTYTSLILVVSCRSRSLGY